MSDVRATSVRITQAFNAIADLGIALGVQLDKLPGIWDYVVDPHWRIEVNGQQKELPDHHGMPIKPYHCHITFNGWPAGVLHAFGGVIAAGAIANEDAFIEALNAATARIRAEKTS